MDVATAPPQIPVSTRGQWDLAKGTAEHQMYLTHGLTPALGQVILRTRAQPCPQGKSQHLLQTLEAGQQVATP